MRSGVTSGGQGSTGAERRAERDKTVRRGEEKPAEASTTHNEHASRSDEVWIRDDLRDEATAAVVRSGRTSGRASAEEPEPIDLEEAGSDLGKALDPARAARAEKKLQDAARSFRRGYDEDARRMLKPLAAQAPASAPIRELYGLTLYRLGRYDAAVTELEAFRQLTGSTEQHPVLADCYRALRKFDAVEELWDDLRSASPSAELVTEGRIVAAGALADQGRLRDAIRVLSDGWRVPKRPQEHHLRRAYALADLLERAGDVPRARELFRRVHAADPRFGDVAQRVRSL